MKNLINCEFILYSIIVHVDRIGGIPLFVFHFNINLQIGTFRPIIQ